MQFTVLYDDDNQGERFALVIDEVPDAETAARLFTEEMSELDCYIIAVVPGDVANQIRWGDSR